MSTIPTPIIKPLKWDSHKGGVGYWGVYLSGYLLAFTIYFEWDGCYRLDRDIFARIDRSFEGGDKWRSRHPTLEAAQAAAQEDWERFVRAAVTGI